MTVPPMTGDGAADDGLTVRGGRGGTEARLEDLDLAARLLLDSGQSLAQVAVAVLMVARDPMLLASVALSPLSGAQAEFALAAALGGSHGLLACGGRAESLGVAVEAAVAAYRTADALTAAVLHELDLMAGRLVGNLAATVFPIVRFVPIDGLITMAARLAAARLGGDPQAAAGVGLGAGVAGGVGQRVLALLARHPGVAEHLVDAVPGVIDGLRDPLPTPIGGVAMLPLPLLAASPGDPRAAAALIGELGRVSPLLRESGQARVTVVAQRTMPPPSGLSELISRVGLCSPDQPGLDGTTTRPGTLRVERVTSPGGARAWIVEIPGTHDWSPRTGRDPFDLTSDVRALGGQTSGAGAAVVQALRTAGATPTEPVLLAGHSLGGMVAAQLAADPVLRSQVNVTHIVTVGSPIALAGVPPQVQVLAIEHDDDLVPRLDGTPNPDRPGWVTVSRPATPPVVSSAGASPDDVMPQLTVTHDASTYARTAALVDASDDPSLIAWRAGLQPFLNHPGAQGETLEVVTSRA